MKTSTPSRQANGNNAVQPSDGPKSDTPSRDDFSKFVAVQVDRLLDCCPLHSQYDYDDFNDTCTKFCEGYTAGQIISAFDYAIEQSNGYPVSPVAIRTGLDKATPKRSTLPEHRRFPPALPKPAPTAADKSYFRKLFSRWLKDTPGHKTVKGKHDDVPSPACPTREDQIARMMSLHGVSRENAEKMFSEGGEG